MSKNRLKILYFSCEDVPASHAGAVHTLEVAKNLVNLGHSVTLFSLRREDQPAYEVVDGVEVIRVWQKVMGIKLPLISAPHLPYLMRRNFDIVMERYITAGGLGAIYSLIKRTPLVLEVNSPHVEEIIYRWNITSPIIKAPLRYWVNFQFSQSKGNITTIPTIIPDFSRDKTHIIYWGADHKMFGRHLKNTETADEFIKRYHLKGKFLVLFVGSFREWQGIYDLPDIIEITSKIIPNVLFLLIGGGGEEVKLMNYIHKKGLGKFCLFLGPQPYSLIPYIMALSDVGLAPFNTSHYKPLENFGFFWAPAKLMEYLASGLPVVVSRYDTLQNIVGNGDRGILVTPDRPAEYAEAIKMLHDEPKLREKLSKNAIRYIYQHQSWQKHTEALEKVLIKVVTENKKSNSKKHTYKY
ncbi:MAG: glycosyltransferase family 4 protein [bacterium]